MSGAEDVYMLGTSNEELERLGFQHQIWQGETLDLWRKAGFGQGDSLVDLGCGPGFATFDLARLVRRDGRVAALDSAQKFVDHLAAQVTAGGREFENVSCHRCSIEDLPFEDASFDGAFARWLFCFLERPEKAVAEVSRVVRPGGRMVIIDYFNYLAARVIPGSEAVNALFQAYDQSAKMHGGNYSIGNHLPRMLARNGFDILNLEPICKLGGPDSAWWHWVSSFNKVYVPKLVALGIWTETVRAEFERAWKDAEMQPGTMFFTPPMIGIVARKREQ